MTRPQLGEWIIANCEETICSRVFWVAHTTRPYFISLIELTESGCLTHHSQWLGSPSMPMGLDLLAHQALWCFLDTCGLPVSEGGVSAGFTDPRNPAGIRPAKWLLGSSIESMSWIKATGRLCIATIHTESPRLFGLISPGRDQPLNRNYMDREPVSGFDRRLSKEAEHAWWRLDAVANALDSEKPPNSVAH